MCGHQAVRVQVLSVKAAALPAADGLFASGGGDERLTPEVALNQHPRLVVTELLTGVCELAAPLVHLARVESEGAGEGEAV